MKDYPLLSTLKILKQHLTEAFGQDIPLIPYEVRAYGENTSSADIQAAVFLPDLSPQSLSQAENIAINVTPHAGLAVSLTPLLHGDEKQVEARRAEAAITLLEATRGLHAGARKQKAAAEALEFLRRSRESGQIWLTLGRDESMRPSERINAAIALGRLGHVEDAEYILLAIAKNEQAKASMRIKAAKALAWMGRVQKAAPILLAIARENRSPVREREKAARTLAVLKSHALASQAYLSLLMDEGLAGLTRIEAAEALGSLGRAEEVVSTLRRLVQQNEDASVRAEAARVLGDFGHAEEAAATLLSIAQDREVVFWTRFRALWLLHGWKRTKEAVKILHLMVQDEWIGDGVRQMAADMLAELEST